MNLIICTYCSLHNISSQRNAFSGIVIIINVIHIKLMQHNAKVISKIKSY